MLNQFFSTEEFMAITGFSRGKLDKLRRRKILVSTVINLPRYTYFDLLKLLLFAEFKPYRTLKETTCILVAISDYMEAEGSFRDVILASNCFFIGEIGEFNYILFKGWEDTASSIAKGNQILNFLGDVKQTLCGVSNVFPGQEIIIRDVIRIDLDLLRNKAIEVTQG